jgi:hypothetical protein
VYHIVSVDWLAKWKVYVKFEENKCSFTPGDPVDARMEVEDDIAKLHIHKEGNGETSDSFPGIINSASATVKFISDEVYLKHPHDATDSCHLKNSAKEG